ncbi:MarR family winged helix-turn-helix transcriptional regulator [Leucobacter sp.]
MQEHSTQTAPATDDSPRGTEIAGIISEFSEIFASARTRWVRYAEEVHPDLNGGGIMVLQIVLRKGPVTATGLSQMLGMDKAMVSRHIAKLRELELIETEAAPEDRRVILLTVSERARRLMERIRERWAHSYHERFEDWSLESLEQLRDGLHRFNASTEDAHRTDGPATRCARDHGGGVAADPEDAPAG